MYASNIEIVYIDWIFSLSVSHRIDLSFFVYRYPTRLRYLRGSSGTSAADPSIPTPSPRPLVGASSGSASLSPSVPWRWPFVEKRNGWFCDQGVGDIPKSAGLVKRWHLGHFSPRQIVFRGLGLVLYRKQTTRNPTQPYRWLLMGHFWLLYIDLSTDDQWFVDWSIVRY